MYIDPDVKDILDRRIITAEDVARLRRKYFEDGTVSTREADEVFRLDEACEDKHADWGALYVDALTDYFVFQSTPRGYISQDQARELIHRITRNNRIESTTELELLANVVHWAEYCPAELAEFVLFAVRESVLDPDEAAYGRGRRPRLIDPVDVELIKRAIYAPATGGGITVTRLEAEVIFDLNDATARSENHPAWQDLFVYAIANHLMFPRPAPAPEPRESVLRREQWLRERRGTGRLLLETGKAAARLDLDFQGFRDALKGPVRALDADQEARDARIAYERETIDEEEARWLIGRIKRDGVLNDNERALLAFIRKHSPNIHPSLEPLLAEAGA